MALEDGLLSPPLPTVPLTGVSVAVKNYLITRGVFGIPYIELAEGYQERFSPEQQESTRICCCKWDQRFAFVADMVGYCKYIPGVSVAGVTTNLSRAIPELHPEINFMYCTSCELIEGIGVQPQPVNYSDIAKALTGTIGYPAVSATPNNNIAYNLAKYRCRYEALPYAVYSDASAPADPLGIGDVLGEKSRFVQRVPEISADNLKLPGGQLQFPSGQTINEPGALPVPTMELTYIWHQVPVVPWTAIRQAMGKVNNAVFDPTYANVGAQTILCNAPIIWLGRTATGDWNYKITYKFSYRPNYANDGVTEQGWNYFYRRNVGGVLTNPGGYDGPVADKNDATKLAFKTFDFNQLFILPASGGYG